MMWRPRSFRRARGRRRTSRTCPDRIRKCCRCSGAAVRGSDVDTRRLLLRAGTPGTPCSSRLRDVDGPPSRCRVRELSSAGGSTVASSSPFRPTRSPISMTVSAVSAKRMDTPAASRARQSSGLSGTTELPGTEQTLQGLDTSVARPMSKLGQSREAASAIFESGGSRSSMMRCNHRSALRS